MPDFVLEVKSKSIYGPFTYAAPGKLKADFLAGRLPLDEANAILVDNLQGVTVKEVKPER